MDDGVAAMLRALNDAFPAVEQMSATEARADTSGGPLTMRVYRHLGTGGAGEPGVVFYHGGGFVLCDIDSHDGFCRKMAARTSSVVVSVGYRLAPEHPAAAAKDAYAAFGWVVRNTADVGIDAQRVAVAGDSAGGNLAAVASILCRDRGTALPVAQILLYPVIDPACDTPSHRQRATGYVTTHAALQWYWRQYLGGTVLPEAAGLPPAIFVTATLDPLHGRRLRSEAVPAVHRDFRGLFHGVLTVDDFAPAIADRKLLWPDMRRILSGHPAEVAS